MQLSAMYQHYSHLPYGSYNKQDGEEILSCSLVPQEVARLDLLLLPLILWEVQMKTSLHVVPTHRHPQRCYLSI